MAPRPAPDLDLRRDRITRAARDIAASDGWSDVTMRRLATEVGVTQPVLYSAFPAGRQAVVDAVAVAGFSELAAALDAAAPAPLPRMQAYLAFAAAFPSLYEAMFVMPSALPFGDGSGPEPLRHAFAALEAAFPGADPVRAEVAWATLHGLATLQIGGRLPDARRHARLQYAQEVLSR